MPDSCARHADRAERGDAGSRRHRQRLTSRSSGARCARERGLLGPHYRGRSPGGVAAASAANATSRRRIWSIRQTGISQRPPGAPGPRAGEAWSGAGPRSSDGDTRLADAARRRDRGRVAESKLPDRRPDAGAGTRVLIDGCSPARGRRAAATSRARTTRSPPRWRRAAPIGRPIDRSRGTTASRSLPIAPEDYDFLLVERERARPCRRFCDVASPIGAQQSARSACAPPTSDSRRTVMMLFHVSRRLLCVPC